MDVSTVADVLIEVLVIFWIESLVLLLGGVNLDLLLVVSPLFLIFFLACLLLFGWR